MMMMDGGSSTMMIIIIIGWGGVGGGVRRRRPTTDFRLSRYLSPSVPPPLPLLPDETPKVRPSVRRPYRDHSPPTSPRPYYVALCTLPHIGGGDDLSPSGQNRGYAPNFEIGSRGAEEDRELPRPSVRSSVRSLVRLRRRTMTMTPDLLDFCTRTWRSFRLLHKSTHGPFPVTS